jgi:NitT/TauT family transport system substrate-binding protein
MRWPVLRVLLAAVWLAAACAPAPPAPAAATPATTAPSPAPAPPAPARARFASQFIAGDVPAFVAAERGYFREEGVEVHFERFGNQTDMVAALSQGQVDAAGVGGTVAMFNAVARDVPLKIVLDKGTFRPGFGFTALTARKDLYESGRLRRLEDLRGLTVAMLPPPRGTGNAAALWAGLQRVGLTFDDLTVVALTFPDMIPAFANGAIDAALMAEPFLSRALGQGSAVRLIGQDEMYPNYTVSAVCFTGALYADRPAARAFVRAYLRGIRDYLTAVARPSDDPERQRMEELMAGYTGIDAATVRVMVPASFSPNGLPNRESLLFTYQFFRDQGLIPEPLSDAAVAGMWGTELVEEVLRELGRWPEDWGLRPAS